MWKHHAIIISLVKRAEAFIVPIFASIMAAVWLPSLMFSFAARITAHINTSSMKVARLTPFADRRNMCPVLVVANCFTASFARCLVPLRFFPLRAGFAEIRHPVPFDMIANGRTADLAGLFLPVGSVS